MIKVTEDQLRKWYLEENLSSGEIAKLVGCGKTWIVKLLRKYNLTSQKSLQARKQHAFENVAKTNLERYGSPSPFGSKEVQAKATETILEKYGVDHPTRSKEIRKKIQQTCLERYGSESPFGNKEVQKKIAEKCKLGITQQKCNETKRLNGTFNTSEYEEQAYHMLVEKFGYIDVFRQHKTAEYPFPCDFYIKSLGLYIEFQGSWCHGNVPFDHTNPIHQKLISKWKSKGTEYFDYAIKIWSERDPLKREVAKKNNLNWKEFFTIEELHEWLSSI